MRLISSILLLAAACIGTAQNVPLVKPSGKIDEPKTSQGELDRRVKMMNLDEKNGVSVRLKDISRFRGIRGNQLMGFGLVIGLAGTGDTRRNPQAAAALSNYLKSINMDAQLSNMEPKNAAWVVVTAELPAFTTNGQQLDVTVSSAGDAQSLRGGTLLRTELYAVGDNETIYTIAQGSVSISGFGAAAGGNQSTTGFMTVGRVPNGGIVERGAPTKLVYDGKMYLELMDSDLTTASRIQEMINKKYPELNAVAENGQTISVNAPKGVNPITTMARLEEMTVNVDNAAIVIINEKSGAITIGGNVKIAPSVIAVGSISVEIQEQVSVSQPNPFSKGTTEVVANQRVNANQGEADVAVLAPNTTVADLARIFQELRLKANDIINILQLLRQQGALKARLIIQ
ncbi:MAG: flagellar basal body P-ring protein FlgI [Armatimonadota bacterium]